MLVSDNFAVLWKVMLLLFTAGVILMIVGAIGLLVAVMFSAALSSKAAELNALGTTTTIDFWRQLRPLAAADEARRLAQDLIIQPDAIAVIVRDKEGKFHTHTSHHLVGGGATWGMFWGLLFGLLFFIPVFGMAIGAGMGALSTPRQRRARSRRS
jgi:Na+/proline symporter